MVTGLSKSDFVRQFQGDSFDLERLTSDEGPLVHTLRAQARIRGLEGAEATEWVEGRLQALQRIGASRSDDGRIYDGQRAVAVELGALYDWLSGFNAGPTVIGLAPPEQSAILAVLRSQVSRDSTLRVEEFASKFKEGSFVIARLSAADRDALREAGVLERLESSAVRGEVRLAEVQLRRLFKDAEHYLDGDGSGNSAVTSFVTGGDARPTAVGAVVTALENSFVTDAQRAAEIDAMRAAVALPPWLQDLVRGQTTLTEERFMEIIGSRVLDTRRIPPEVQTLLSELRGPEGSQTITFDDIAAKRGGDRLIAGEEWRQVFKVLDRLDLNRSGRSFTLHETDGTLTAAGTALALIARYDVDIIDRDTFLGSFPNGMTVQNLDRVVESNQHGDVTLRQALTDAGLDVSLLEREAGNGGIIFGTGALARIYQRLDNALDESSSSAHLMTTTNDYGALQETPAGRVVSLMQRFMQADFSQRPQYDGYDPTWMVDGRLRLMPHPAGPPQLAELVGVGGPGKRRGEAAGALQRVLIGLQYGIGEDDDAGPSTMAAYQDAVRLYNILTGSNVAVTDRVTAEGARALHIMTENRLIERLPESMRAAKVERGRRQGGHTERVVVRNIGANASRRDEYAETRAALAFVAFRSLLESRGFSIRLSDGHRTHAEQEQLRRRVDKETGLTWAQSGRAVAVGSSRHHSGVAIDMHIKTPNGGQGAHIARGWSSEFGWTLPRHTYDGGVETWHWEYDADQLTDAVRNYWRLPDR